MNADLHRNRREEEPNLRGTFAGVMLVGAFIIITWLGVFLLFIQRG